MLFNREYDFTYGAGNRLLSYACDNVRFTYDDDGNVSSKSTPEGTTQYQWDSENRLIGITKPDGTVIAYQYDELGRRIGKTVGPQQWRWSYLGQEIHRESSWSGLRFYTHGTGIDEHLSMGSNYYVADGLGSIRQIVDAGGNLLNQYRYTAFGKMKQVQAAVGNTYAFTAREWDADAGLYYYRARWYDPDVGRFLARDPIGFAGGDIDLYGYCLNDPVSLVDPEGEAWWVPAVAAVLVGIIVWEEIVYPLLHPEPYMPTPHVEPPEPEVEDPNKPCPLPDSQKQKPPKRPPKQQVPPPRIPKPPRAR